MSIDLLSDWTKKKEPQQEGQQPTEEKGFKEQIEEMYGYDEESKQNEETLMKKFMDTVEKMRETRAKQMRSMID